MVEEKEPEAVPPVPPPDVETAAPAATPTPPEPVEDWATRFKYLLADFENFRKRAAKEREFLRRDVRADVLLTIIPLYEAAQRAREAVARLPSTDPVRKGIELLAREWMAFFDAEHMIPVARVGDRFRAEWHEAVAEAPPTGAATDGTILEVIQQGYRIDAALLRPAKVAVARAPPSSGPAAAASEAASEPDTLDSG
ncbi:MAG: nucleotide exchange factor GrpE [Thermoplasmata archaeon]|nr:nucleotide exchange factor GrpE [Thermoplasmata archaeon]